nr:hypothetical protein [uncultured Desulfobacter sp.]
MNQAKLWVVSKIGADVVWDQGHMPAEEVGRCPALGGGALSAAESCTGGFVDHLVTDAQSASKKK